VRYFGVFAPASPLRRHVVPHGASRTVRGELENIRHAWRWWSDVGPAALRPLPRVRLKVTPKHSRHTPCRSDVLRVLGALDGWPRMVTLLLYGTGARPGEIRDLTWADVDLRNAEVRVDEKTGERFVPIGPDVVAALVAWRGSDAVDPGASLWPVTFYTFQVFGPTYLAPACKRAGVKRFTPYGLRRAAVDSMARAGVDAASAAAVTGHSVNVMLQKYRQVSREDRRAAVRRAGLGSLGGNVVPFPAAAGE
jgi:integrase